MTRKNFWSVLLMLLSKIMINLLEWEQWKFMLKMMTKVVLVLERQKNREDMELDLKYLKQTVFQKRLHFGTLKKLTNGFLRLGNKQLWQLLGNEFIFMVDCRENLLEICAILIQDLDLNGIKLNILLRKKQFLMQDMDIQLVCMVLLWSYMEAVKSSNSKIKSHKKDF